MLAGEAISSRSRQSFSNYKKFFKDYVLTPEKQKQTMKHLLNVSNRLSFVIVCFWTLIAYMLILDPRRINLAKKHHLIFKKAQVKTKNRDVSRLIIIEFEFNNSKGTLHI